MTKFERSVFDNLIHFRLYQLCELSVLMKDSGAGCLMSVGRGAVPSQVEWIIQDVPVTAYNLARLVAWLYDPTTQAFPKDTIVELLKQVLNNLTRETQFREQMHKYKSPLAACSEQVDQIKEQGK